MLLVADSFGGYSSPADAGTGQGAWTSAPSGNCVLSPVTRFGVGRSMHFFNAFVAQFTFTGTDNHALMGSNISFMLTDPLGGTATCAYITYMDGATPQCTVIFRSDGSILLTSGGVNGSGVPTGSTLATFAGAFVSNSFDGWQFQTLIDPSSGTFNVRKNRDSAARFTATGLNTRGGTSNSYANSIIVGGLGDTNLYIQDTLHYNGNVAGSPNTWVGDVRTSRQMPIQDTVQADYTGVSSGALALNFSTPGSSSYSFNADTLYVSGANGVSAVATQGGLLTSATVNFGTGFTGNVLLGVYLKNGDTMGLMSDNLAGTLIGVSAPVTNPSASQVFTFSGAVPIKTGYAYGYALLSNAPFTVTTATGGIGDRLSYYTTGITYAGGMPTNLIGVAPAAVNTSNFPAVVGTLTANGAGYVNDNAQDGTQTYLQNATVNQSSLFNIEPLAAAVGYTPAKIIGVNLRSYVAKSDSGGRGFKVSGVSGATPFQTPEYSPLTFYGNFNTWYANDPNTTMPWTPAAVDALKIGPLTSS